MKILAIDTSSKVASVAVLEDSIVLGEFSINTPRTHSQKLMLIIKDLLSYLETSLDDIDLIAVCNGPGSFTGVRIGLTTAKGFAQAKGIDVVQVSSLEGLAYNVKHFKGIVCPMIDARRDYVFTTLYKNGESIIQEDKILIDQLLSQLDEEPVIFVGDGAIVHKDKIKSILGEKAFFASSNSMLPRGSSIGMCSIGKQRRRYDNVHANYLKKSQAELSLEKK